MGRGELHLVVDRCRPAVERSAKDERKSEDVVHLIRVIRAPGGHDDVVARGARIVVGDFRIGIGHGEHNRIFRHRLHHLLRDDAANGESNEHIRALHRLGERARFGVRCKLLFVRRHVDGAPFENHAVAVGENHVLLAHSEFYVEPQAAHRCGASSADHEFDLLDFFAGDFERVHQRGRRNDRRAVLIVVKHRNLHLALEPLLDLEALRRGDVLQIDAAERRLQQLHRTDERLGIARF